MTKNIADPNLARAIEEARNRKAKTQIALVRATGLSLGTVRGACQGLASKRTLSLLARALGVEFDTLTGKKASP